MALLDALIARIPEPRLREEIAAAVRRLTGGRSFGLVFEEHVPETTPTLEPYAAQGMLAEFRVPKTTGG
jgi:adenine-specific DNA-methyltransferase